MEIPYTVETRPDTGLANGKLGIWLFLASEVMLFGALFSTYIILRVGAVEWPHGELNVWLGMFNTFVLIGSSVTMVMAWASLKIHDWGKHRLFLSLTLLLSAVFLVVKYFEYSDHLAQGRRPLAQHVLRDLLHADRPARVAHPRRHGRDALPAGTRREAVQEESRTVHESDRVHGPLLALRRPRVDFPVPGFVLALDVELQIADCRVQ